MIAAVSPPDRHGYFSLGTGADYAASFIGRARFFVEANARMPRTFGRNQLHLSQVAGWIRSDLPLVEVEPVQPTAIDRRIAAYVAERIPDGATIQTGIGAIPNAILANLGEHRALGIHTELLSDGVIELIESGVVTGARKRNNRTKTVGTFVLGTQRLYDFVADNPAVELWPAAAASVGASGASWLTTAEEPSFLAPSSPSAVPPRMPPDPEVDSETLAGAK